MRGQAWNAVTHDGLASDKMPILSGCDDSVGLLCGGIRLREGVWAWGDRIVAIVSWRSIAAVVQVRADEESFWGELSSLARV
jgi:hypothetical protein